MTRAIAIAPAFLALFGCVVPTPQSAPFGKEVVGFLGNEGTTDREVLTRLGPPDSRLNDGRKYRYIEYQRFAHVIAGGGYSAGAAPLFISWELMIEFAPDGRVVRYSRTNLSLAPQSDSDVRDTFGMRTMQ